jgi:hypothetical protein
MKELPPPGPESTLRTVEINADRWGRYQIFFNFDMATGVPKAMSKELATLSVFA